MRESFFWPSFWEISGYNNWLHLLPVKIKHMVATLPSHAYLEELKTESLATQKCLVRISAKDFEFKPHPKSMSMGYLALLVAEIPLWIWFIIEKGEIDFATFKHSDPKTTNELVDHFESNMH